MTTATAKTPAKATANSLFSPFDPTRSYGCCSFSGRGERFYHADMIELAIRSNSIPMIEETVARGWLAPECRAFDNSLVIDYCEMRGANTVADYLRTLGWPERRKKENDMPETTTDTTRTRLTVEQ